MSFINAKSYLVGIGTKEEKDIETLKLSARIYLFSIPQRWLIER